MPSYKLKGHLGLVLNVQPSVRTMATKWLIIKKIKKESTSEVFVADKDERILVLVLTLLHSEWPKLYGVR